MAKCTFLLQSESSTAQIYLRFSLGRSKTLKKKTGLIIDSKRWSLTNKSNPKASVLNKAGFPKTTSAEGKQIKNQLLELSIFIERQYNLDNTEGVEINSNWLENQIDICFNRVEIKSNDNYLTDWIQKKIDEAPTLKNVHGKKGLSQSRINDYNRLKSIIEEFEKHSKSRLRINDINKSFEKKFIEFMEVKNKYAESYRMRTMGNIKTICFSAEGYEGVVLSPELKKLESKKPDNEFVITLDEKELEAIEKTNLTSSGLENARLWLLIGCNIGQRVSDLLKITEEHITQEGEDQFIELQQQKTGSKVVIPILPKAKKYFINGLPYPISSQKFNVYIKEICKQANINKPTKGRLLDKKTNRNIIGTYPKWQLISSHICRRSFCTNFFGKVPTPLIMAISSHQKESTFMNYIGKTSKDYAKMLLDHQKKTYLEELKKEAQAENIAKMKIEPSKKNNLESN